MKIEILKTRASSSLQLGWKELLFHKMDLQMPLPRCWAVDYAFSLSTCDKRRGIMSFIAPFFFYVLFFCVFRSLHASCTKYERGNRAQAQLHTVWKTMIWISRFHL